MNSLRLELRHTDTGPVLDVVGHLDFHTAPRFRELLDDLTLQPGDLLVLDLTGLDFCDSSGITAFLVARNAAEAARAEVALAGVPPNTARVLRIVGLDQVFRRHSFPGEKAHA
ncbi:STAS domain-containing protein [Streptomyces sp. 549]|uniref:STAS domain-containing protein n=1 Tax=Streptomyces sp. 549 TaxID=3049076 RepID=UPI0024C35FFA|nr:STAS domain-containing protein [Streptomyces sp. 549]MDK1475848.1 STAS domain-containing protein [Streptomyces sp. 549]